MILEIPLLINGKKKLFKTKKLTTTKLYVELANLVNNIVFDTSTIELLNLVKENNLDLTKLQSKDLAYIETLDDKICTAMIETQTRPRGLDFIIANNETYKSIFKLVLEIEITDDIWDAQDFKEVDNIVSQFRTIYK